MAKRKAAGKSKATKPKGKAGKPGKPRATAGSRAKAANARARHRGPRDEPLPGMGEVRIRSLDEICVSIAETRASINELKGEETGLEQTALSLMRKHDKTAWRHSGVELVRVPGEEKLRVRTSQERTATAESAPSDATAAGDEGGDDGLTDAEREEASGE